MGETALMGVARRVFRMENKLTRPEKKLVCVQLVTRVVCIK